MRKKFVYLPLLILVAFFSSLFYFNGTYAYFWDKKPVDGEISLATGFLALEPIATQEVLIKRLNISQSHMVDITNIGTLDGKITIGEHKIKNWNDSLYGPYTNYLSLEELKFNEETNKLEMTLKKIKDWDKTVPMIIEIPVRINQKNVGDKEQGFYDEKIIQLRITNNETARVQKPLYFSAVDGKMTTLVPGEIHVDNNLKIERATLEFWAGSQIIKEIIASENEGDSIRFPKVIIEDLKFDDDVLSASKLVNLRLYPDETNQFLDFSLGAFIRPFVLSSEKTSNESVEVRSTVLETDLVKGVQFYGFNNQQNSYTDDYFSFSDYARELFEFGELETIVRYKDVNGNTVVISNILNDNSDGVEIKEGSIPTGATEVYFEIYRKEDQKVLLEKEVKLASSKTSEEDGSELTEDNNEQGSEITMDSNVSSGSEQESEVTTDSGSSDNSEQGSEVTTDSNFSDGREPESEVITDNDLSDSSGQESELPPNSDSSDNSDLESELPTDSNFSDGNEPESEVITDNDLSDSSGQGSELTPNSGSSDNSGQGSELTPNSDSSDNSKSESELSPDSDFSNDNKQDSEVTTDSDLSNELEIDATTTELESSTSMEIIEIQESSSLPKNSEIESLMRSVSFEEGLVLLESSLLVEEDGLETLEISLLVEEEAKPPESTLPIENDEGRSFTELSIPVEEETVVLSDRIVLIKSEEVSSGNYQKMLLDEELKFKSECWQKNEEKNQWFVKSNDDNFCHQYPLLCRIKFFIPTG